MDSVLLEFTALGVDIIVFSVFYGLYKHRSECVKSLKKAECFEIDNELQNKVASNGNIIPYAVISGTVKALGTPLRSQYISHLRGVIREKIVKERKVRWSPILRLWNTVENVVQHSHNTTPFALWSNTGLFKKQTSVEVLNPLSADQLVLSRVYDEYAVHDDNIGDAVIGFFRGERTTGIQEIENFLSEGTILTGIGELIVDNGKLQMKPPQNGLTYFLTTHSLESLIKKLNDEAKFYKISAFVVGAVGLITIFYIVKRGYSCIKEKYDLAQMKKLMKKSKELREIAEAKRASTSANSSNTSGPMCVVCLTTPVQMIVLECGHACLCMNCSPRIYYCCPVCRGKITRLVPAYLP